MTDHRDIVWALGVIGACMRRDDRRKDWGWRVVDEKMERLAEVMKERAKMIDKGKDLVCETMRVLEETCNSVLK